MARILVGIAFAAVLASVAAIAVARATDDRPTIVEAMDDLVFALDITRVTVAPDAPFEPDPRAAARPPLTELPSNRRLGESTDPDFPGLTRCSDWRNASFSSWRGKYGITLTLPDGSALDKLIEDTRSQWTFMGGDVETMDFDTEFISYAAEFIHLRLDIDRTTNTATYSGSTACLPRT